MSALGTWTSRRARRTGPLLLGGAATLAAAAAYAEFVNPRTGLWLPALTFVGMIAYRWPAAAISIAFAMSGAYGSLKAFFGLPANGLATGMIAGMVVASIGALVFAQRRSRVSIWPGAVAAGLYLVALVLMIPFSPAEGPALKVARTAGLYMLSFLLIAYGPWKQGTHGRARSALVWIALGVGAYASLRWMIGASSKERAQVTAVAFNQTSAGHNKVQGSFPSGVELGLWTSCVIPFLLGTLLAEKGRLRAVAMVALPLCVIGLLGSGLRTGLVAAIVGCGVLLVVYAFSLGMPANRPVVFVAVIAALIAGGVALFPTVIGSNANSTKRYHDILDPFHDASFQGRLQKWRQAFNDLHGHPFGFGLGTVGPEAQAQPFVRGVNLQLDSSYVRIAYEQGIGVMVLFIAALVLLLAGFVRRAIATVERARAGPAIAATGTLVAFMVTMFSEMFSTAPCALAIWVILGLGMAPFTRLDSAGPAAR